MYIVNAKNSSGGFIMNKFEHLDEAKELVKKLYEEGHRDVFLSQEIPMKVKVTIEF
ncbi:hypothetical protein [Metabacillus fastidiosus]|uniref:Uncharacterized protein n=1 Tax=Metabacillus fastidiosus TaxID=1458 RepID=A0ABU6NUC8_9BACI|nr:hypothetical protein [Metabacillus fastidiosus]